MTNDTPDRERERAYWTAAAPSWGRWADAMAAIADKLNQPLLDAAGVAPGHRVLDLASGAGEPAFSIANRVGVEGLVVASDLAPPMLAQAARRPAKPAAAPVVFAGADMTALPFAPASFDAVTCRFGVMFVPDVGAALAAIHAALRPGGAVALMVWGPLAENALFHQIGLAIEDRLGHALGRDAALSSLFRFAAPGGLEAMMEGTGFTSVSAQDIRATRRAPLGQRFWESALEMTFGHRLGGLDPTARAGLETAIDARFAALAVDDGDGPKVPLPLSARVIVGRK